MIARDLLQESSLLLKEEGAMGFLECELMLSAVLGISREELFVCHKRMLTPFEEKIFWEFFARRMKGEPLAYILGKKEFYGLEFLVDQRVMIPRPETEMIVEWVISKAPEFAQVSRGVQCENARFFLVDVGTGSGNIAISVAKNVLDARVFALDISEGALEVCEKNVLAHGVCDRVVVRRSDLLEGRNDSVFIISANLPYIGTEKNRYISRSVEDFEPHEALFGGADGLEWYRRLFRQISALKTRPRYVVGEIGFTQGEAILEEIRAVFPKAKAEVKEDLSGLPRMFVLEIYA